MSYNRSAVLGGAEDVPVPRTSETSIHDFSWMVQLLSEHIRERFTYAGFRAVGLEISPASRSPYRFRMLFFPGSSQKPVLSLNLETSILGSSCFTEQDGDRHVNLGPADPETTYDVFREKALSEAKRILQ